MNRATTDIWLFRFFAVFVVSALLGMSFPARAAWQTPATSAPAPAAAPQPDISIQQTQREPFYQVTAHDVGNAVAEQLELQGVEGKAEVILAPGTPRTMYRADRAITVVIHTLQVDVSTKRWQAQAYFISNGKTETVVPVSGTYGAMLDVPVLTRQFTRNDVIEASDIEMRSMPERLLRKDTVLDTSKLVGMSPRSGISAGRPIHGQEVTAPTVIKRGDLVEMAFSTPYIKIRATGVALEDGAVGSFIRIKNQKSERAISAQVVSTGHVRINNGASL